MLNTLYDYLVWRAAQLDPKQRNSPTRDLAPTDKEGQQAAFTQWALAHA